VDLDLSRRDAFRRFFHKSCRVRAVSGEPRVDEREGRCDAGPEIILDLFSQGVSHAGPKVAQANPSMRRRRQS
jgi:hypothetical protein